MPVEGISDPLSGACEVALFVFRGEVLVNESDRINLRILAALDQYNALLADVARLPRIDRRLWYAAEETRWIEGLIPHATAEIRAVARHTTRQMIADGLRQVRRARW
jgi:hypothetical protein